jgi:hypothetical protein
MTAERYDAFVSYGHGDAEWAGRAGCGGRHGVRGVRGVGGRGWVNEELAAAIGRVTEHAD